MTNPNDNTKVLSLIVPCYNESENIYDFYNEFTQLWDTVSDRYNYELVFIDDGSKDSTSERIEIIAKQDSRVKLIEFSRNFGKEIALTAGVQNCTGDACIFVDSDLQYPIEKIPEFLSKWEEGYDVVVGMRDQKQTNSIIEKIGSKLFYLIINSISETKIESGALDYRLLDRKVIDAFEQFSERGRMTRALVDWLGFKRTVVHYQEKARNKGVATYSFLKRVKLALSAIVSNSLFPLRFAGYLGVLISAVSGTFGFYLFIDKYVLNQALPGYFSGPFMAGILAIFLNGIVLSCLGLISLYIENIHQEAINRPLYVVRNQIQ